jgi:peptidoglycan hydrolase-like protein with peptidoglycan-binding domain
MTCIKQGDRGPEVKNLQELLNGVRETLNERFSYEALEEDSIFGPATADAVLRYQASECWAESDIFESAAQAGPLTMAQLNEGGGSSPSSDFNDYLIPVASGQAVSPGWGNLSAPIGVTWHWTATWDLATCRKILGGSNALRKGEASAHFGVGRTQAEGVDRYVLLENRSWHCGKGQTLTVYGKEMTDPDQKGARTTVGIETVNIGYARDGVDAGEDWIRVLSGNGRQELLIQP